MKVLFCIFGNVRAYGMRLLHAILQDAKFDCRLLFIQERNFSLIAEAIGRFNPDVVGFSLVSPNFAYYKRIYPALRALGSFKILVGGWHATLEPESCAPYADIVCRGEGEDIILQILSDVSRGQAEAVYIGSRTDVTKLPAPKLSSANNSSVCVAENGRLDNHDPLLTSGQYDTMIGRGCPHRCTYCSNSFMKVLDPSWSKIRFNPYDQVLEELINAKGVMQPHINKIAFYDEVFMPPRVGRSQFFDDYKHFVNLPFYVLFYPGACSDELAAQLKTAGLDGIWCGVQSGSERVRREVFGRPGSNKFILRQADIFSKYGIKARYDFIFDNPFETKEEQEETKALIRLLPQPHSINVFRLKFFPNTELTKKALKMGLITEDQAYEAMNHLIGETVNSLEELEQALERDKAGIAPREKSRG